MSDRHETSNAEFISDFTKWLFQETGVVKVISTTHHREGESAPLELYRIKDDLVSDLRTRPYRPLLNKSPQTYSLTVAAHYTTPNGTSYWGPWHADDVQMDFTMLDPHIRTALKEDKSVSPSVGTTYTAKFRAPDRHGVFKFVVEYWRPG
jgi:oligosaccharyltransferase complex subunit beta